MFGNFKKMIRPFVDNYFGQIRNRRISYSQEGEDLVVDRLLNGKRNGFYVEVGCHHPYRYSNTFMFYKKGWRGICIHFLALKSYSMLGDRVIL